MVNPIVAQNSPFSVDVTEGESYWWCACGRSQTQPFCDGSHAGSGIEPVEYTAKATKTLFFCGCKATKRPPFCDGTHSNL